MEGLAKKQIKGPRAFTDLHAFVHFLEERQELVRVDVPVDPRWEITEICANLLAGQGPAVLFTKVEGSHLPLLANLFGTEQRVGMAIGHALGELESLGELLAALRSPEPPGHWRDGLHLLKRLARVRHMPLHWVKRAPCQEIVLSGDDVDLGLLPIQTCWPGDAGPLITWPLVISRAATGGPVNIGVYRMQVLGKNRLIVRWLAHRGGAQHARTYAGKRMPLAVAIGADPALLLAAVTPIPETMSEYAFAGLLREKRVEVYQSDLTGLPLPARAEIILEGEVNLEELVEEGPFGDHTGYYNEVERFPVFTVQRISMRRQPIYLSTFTGRPPDEPAILALALNRVFVPLLRKQFPEIRAFHLPMEACSYRVAVVSIDKQYPGHAFRLMAGVWGFLRQFLYTKYLIVVDAGVRVQDWEAVMEAVWCNVYPNRDLHLFTNTPIDYLDFASPVAGLGSKLGIDATAKMGAELEAVEPRPDQSPSHACDWPIAVLRMVPLIREIRPLPGGCMAVVQIDKQTSGDGRRVVETIWRQVPPGSGADQIWVVDDDINPGSWNDLWWAIATRTDPARDLIMDREGGRFALDATVKWEGESKRRWGQPIAMEPAIVEKVDQRWLEYGFLSRE